MTGFHHMNFHDVLEDLQTRFIINIPVVELSSIERICFQIEQAHWFYEDFVREVSPSLPSLSLKNFSGHFFKQCPLLINWAGDHEVAYATFMEYKVRVPVCGAIILNENLDKVLLVRGWKSKSGWGFPKGKINKEEPEAECAIREVLEETGYDISSKLIPSEHVERTMKEQRIRLYIIRGVPESTEFVTQTRKEIGDIRWFGLHDLPGFSDKVRAPIGKFYMVTAFVTSLKKWIQKFKMSKKAAKSKQKSLKAAGRIPNYNSSIGYKSPNEGDSESDFVMPDAGKLVNQDNEDWGVNTLHHATDVIKSLIGIGSNANDIVPASVQRSTSEIPGPVFPHQQFAQQHYQNFQMQNSGQFPSHPGQVAPSQQYFGQSNAFAPHNPFMQNAPLQGIITTADGTNTHAMIQILPFSPTTNYENPQIPAAQQQQPNQQLQQHQSSSNSTYSAGPVSQDVTAEQLESLIHQLKANSGAPTSQPPQNNAHRRSINLKTMPPPPKVNHEVDTMSEEIHASYGGGGGGPAIQFGKLGSNQPRASLPATGLPSDNGSQKNVLLNILTKGSAPAVLASGDIDSRTEYKKPGHTSKKNPEPQAPLLPQYTIMKRPGNPQTEPTSAVHSGSSNKGVGAHEHKNDVNNNNYGEDDGLAEDFMLMNINRPNAHNEQRSSSQSRKQSERISESLNDPWTSAAPASVVQNASRKRDRSTQRSSATAVQPVSLAERQQPLSIMSQTLLGVLQGGPQKSPAVNEGIASDDSAGCMSTHSPDKSHLMDILMGKSGEQHKGPVASSTQSDAKALSTAAQRSVQSDEIIALSAGGGGGPRFSRGGGGGGGLGMGFFSDSKGSTVGATTQNPDALRAILGIPMQNQGSGNN